MGNVSIFLVEDKRQWNEQLEGMWKTDFYFTNDYHAMSKTDTDIPFLFSYRESDYHIIFPLILRKIQDTDYSDATSVYGYAGPLTSQKNIPCDILNNFISEFTDFLYQKNIISVFSRLHPYIQNDKYLSTFGELGSLSQTVFIDLETDSIEQIKQYRKGVKSDLGKLKKEGYEILEDQQLLNLDTFIKIYNENMRRVNASTHYYFSQKYFDEFFSSKEIGARLFLVKKNCEIIAGSIFTFVNGVIQYHLSGTRSEYLKNSPARLIIDHVRQIGNSLDYSILHLGGGVGSNNDSLFNFKAGFSKSRFEFKIWKFIVNNSVYNSLVKESGVIESNTYFPLYRTNNRQL